MEDEDSKGPGYLFEYLRKDGTTLSFEVFKSIPDTCVPSELEINQRCVLTTAKGRRFDAKLIYFGIHGRCCTLKRCLCSTPPLITLEETIRANDDEQIVVEAERKVKEIEDAIEAAKISTPTITCKRGASNKANGQPTKKSRRGNESVERDNANENEDAAESLLARVERKLQNAELELEATKRELVQAGDYLNNEENIMRNSAKTNLTLAKLEMEKYTLIASCNQQIEILKELSEENDIKEDLIKDAKGTIELHEKALIQIKDRMKTEDQIQALRNNVVDAKCAINRVEMIYRARRKEVQNMSAHVQAAKELDEQRKAILERLKEKDKQMNEEAEKARAEVESAKNVNSYRGRQPVTIDWRVGTDAKPLPPSSQNVLELSFSENSPSNSGLLPSLSSSSSNRGQNDASNSTSSPIHPPSTVADSRGSATSQISISSTSPPIQTTSNYSLQSTSKASTSSTDSPILPPSTINGSTSLEVLPPISSFSRSATPSMNSQASMSTPSPLSDPSKFHF